MFFVCQVPGKLMGGWLTFLCEGVIIGGVRSLGLSTFIRHKVTQELLHSVFAVTIKKFAKPLYRYNLAVHFIIDSNTFYHIGQ